MRADERTWRCKNFWPQLHAQNAATRCPVERGREGGGGGNIPWSFILQNYRNRNKIRPRGPHSLCAPWPFLNDNEITLPRQISRVSWVLSYQVCNREKYKIITSFSKSLGLSTESVVTVSFSSNNIHATRFTSKEDFIVCYTAVFSVVTQRSSPLVGRSIALRH